MFPIPTRGFTLYRWLDFLPEATAQLERDRELSEMVERVARAIHGVSDESDGVAYGALVREMARAAIEALREPTKSMIEAGTNKRAANEMWNAMINEALK